MNIRHISHSNIKLNNFIFKMNYFSFIPQELVDVIFIYTDIRSIFINYNLFKITLNNKYNMINKILYNFPMINIYFLFISEVERAQPHGQNEHAHFDGLENNVYTHTLLEIFQYFEEINRELYIEIFAEKKYTSKFGVINYPIKKVYSKDLLKLKSIKTIDPNFDKLIFENY